MTSSGVACQAQQAALDVVAQPFSKPLSNDFLKDLTSIYREFPPELTPEECIAELARRFEAARAEHASRKAAFLRDLIITYNSLGHNVFGPVDDGTLARLAREFESRREKVRVQVAKHFNELAEDDPLRCAVGLFGILQYGRVETAHTRMLAWLLDPSKEHGFGDCLLRALLSFLKGTPIEGQIQVSKVQAEHIIRKGRLDIFAEGTITPPDGSRTAWLLLVEAKVDANEAEDQLWKYERWAHRHGNGREVFRMFLSPDGREPTTAKQPWTPMAFWRLASIFRAAGVQLRNKPGFHLLRHYLAGVLKDICSWTLPVIDPHESNDPYSFFEYLDRVNQHLAKEGAIS